MANSLMELYGGGMTQPATNYQIGGVVSKAKIRSASQRDRAKIQEVYDKNIESMSKYSFLGNVAQTLLDMFVAPGLGGFGKAAIQSFYKPEEVEGLEFGLDVAEEAAAAPGAFKGSVLERGLTSSLTSLLMPDIYKGLGKTAKKIPAGIAEGVSELGADMPMFLGEEGARRWGIGGKEFAKGVRGRAFADPRMPWLTEDWQTSLSPEPWGEAGATYWGSGQVKAGGGLIGETTPQYMHGGTMHKNPVRPEFQYQSNWGELPWKDERSMWSRDLTGNGLDEFDGEEMPPTTTTTTTTPPPPPTPGAAGTYDPMGTYGMQRNVAGALTAAGMEEMMEDPDWEKYAKYMPTWDMGYGAKVGGYRTGAQENLMSYVQPQGPAGQSFKSAGEAERLKRLGRTQTTEKFRTQERGVGEEYTKDVIAAAMAAQEAKGGDPFGPPDTGDKVDSPPNPAQTQHAQWTTYNDRRWYWNPNNGWWEDMGPAGG